MSLFPDTVMTPARPRRLVLIAACVLLLPGCDQISERAGFPDPGKLEAEGKAIGGACRHAGRGLEDCYRLNQEAAKSAVYAGWKEMNEYMVKNNMQAVEPTISPESEKPPKKMKKAAEDTEEAEKGDGSKTTEKAKDKPKPDTDAEDADKSTDKAH
jgi:hypothetical protein